jgi:hypothetical protein
MKVLTITLALAALASTAPLNAQILRSIPSGQVAVNGSWTLVGRDGNGNQIYERRTRDNYGNIVVQRARRDVNGNMTIISSNTVNSNNTVNRGSNDCNYSQSTNSVGDIIFGRSGTNTANCDDRNSRVNGGWYQVGREGNSRIYERQTRDSYGNVVIQHARRNSNGSFTILNSRVVNNNGRGARNDRGNDNNDKEWQKQQKQQDKEIRKSEKEMRKNNKHDNGNHDDGNRD